MMMKTLAILLTALTTARAYTDPQCANYEHWAYGCVGQCMATSSCPGGEYMSNLCPSQRSNIKCCFTADTDSACANYNHWDYGRNGHCIGTSQCPNNAYVSGLCPTKPTNVRCCFRKPTCTCNGGSDACGSDVKSLANQIQNHHRITLQTSHPTHAADGAEPSNNIRDTANGCKAKRSSGCGSSISGTEVCLSATLLRYIKNIADTTSGSRSLVITSLAGACHSSTSRHYRGMAVDISTNGFTSTQYREWQRECRASGGFELGPGDAGHSTHVHCQVYS